VSKTRQLTLNEVVGAGGPLEALVNNSKWNGLRPDGVTPIPGATLLKGLWLTELPVEGETEVWEFVNLTADAHPIHLHGVQFQIMNRQLFDPVGFNGTYDPLFPGGVFIGGYGPPLPNAPADPGYDPLLQGGKLGGNPDVTPFLVGLAQPPAAYEAGWKDTAIMPSGQVTRLVVRFAPQDVAAGAVGSFTFNPSAADGYYVWHCHITDHEDNEMMRPYKFQPNLPDATRSFVQGIDY
jgi:FtsP/CotA-like multicopper oxidase with cupredoxin domain